MSYLAAAYYVGALAVIVIAVLGVANIIVATGALQ